MRQLQAAVQRTSSRMDEAMGRSLLTILTMTMMKLLSSTHDVPSQSTSILHSNTSSAQREYVRELVSLPQVRTASQRHADGVHWLAGW